MHQKKIMVSVWWNARSVIHYSILKPGETITAERYCQEIVEMNKKLEKMWPALVNRKGPLLLRDNARPHVARKSLQKLHSLGFEILPHPPYSPDISPTDYHFFKHLALFLRDRCFIEVEDLKSGFEEFIASREPVFYQIGMNKLVDCWQKCADSDGACFDE
jgi:histone-lysine N-methyltransferase SETMAR